MNLSMKWLSDFVDLDVSIKEFCDGMTMSGSKVEGYETEGENIKNVVVGKLLSIEQHPDADKLVVCQVDIGKEAPIQIVTGATNLKESDVIPVCLNGAVLPNGTKIKKGKLRGVESNGMLCSLSELKLTVNDFPNAIEDGIFVLDEQCALGQDIQSAIGLNDTKVEFEITSNRPDCMSVLGLAREAAATFGTEFKYSQPQVKSSGGDINEYIKVSVENTQLCTRYISKVVKDVKIQPSPRWIRERLRASGVRPINNMVDITNYVMLEYGNPMHAFDLRYTEGAEICVRNARQGESIMTLEGIEHELTPEMLVICDSKKPVGVAGVMGGEYSGIMGDTTTVAFECAMFDGSSIRTTARDLGIRTESSARFEKGLDPRSCYDAMMRACELVEELGAGVVVDGIIDAASFDPTPKTVPFEPEWTNKFLDINLSRQEMADILESLSLHVEGDSVIVPYFRIDLENKADIAEEVARIYGYDNISTTVIRGVSEASFTPEQKFNKKIGDILRALGCYEIMTYSFISPKYYDKINLPAGSELRESVKISNPLGEDTGVMRTTAIPSMLEILSRNYNNRNAKAWLYEIATVYLPNGKDQQPDEDSKVMIGLYGDCDFYTLKGMAEILLERLNVNGWETNVANSVPFHNGRCAEITIDGKLLGTIGEVHPEALSNYDIDTRAYIAELDVNALYENQSEEASYKPLPKFPAVTRDLSLVCDEDLPAGTIQKTIEQSVGSILEEVTLFDVYHGEQIGEGKKSVSYSIVLRSHERTLKDNEADNVIEKTLENLKKIDAVLR